MPTLRSFHASQSVKTDRTWNPWLAVATWLILAAALVLSYQDKLYSTSIDFAAHGTLVSRLMSSWSVPEVDASLAEMAIYPRVAHQLASIAAKLSGSAIKGMQETAITSLFLLWTMVGISFSGLSRNRFIAALAALASILAIGHMQFGIEFFGSELIDSYFFAQLVAQSLGMAILVVAMHKDWSAPDSIMPIAWLGICIPALASVHLLAALELLGALAILAVLHAWRASSEKRIKRILTSIGILVFSAALLVANPDFLAMVRVSANNGVNSLHLVANIRDVMTLAILTVLVCSFMLFRWWQKRGSQTYLEHLFKYFGALGLSSAGLCLAQIFLLRFFELGSVYACLKYAIALQSLLAIAAALLVALCLKQSPTRRPRVAAISKLGGILFAAAMCMCVFSGPIAARTDALVSAEMDARQFAISRLDRAPSKYDLAIEIKDVPAIGNYFISRGVLDSPAFKISMDVLYSRIPGPPEQVDQILTSKASQPWDIPACRRGNAGTLVVLDGDCVYETFRTLACKGIIEFTSQGALDEASQGFTKPDADGRWSEGSAATLTCIQADPAATVAYLDTAGLVSAAHPQHMTISVNDEGAQTIEYSMQAPSRTIEIPLPSGSAGKLEFRFEFPDAISPAELGINADQRKLGIKIYRLRFE